MWRTVAILVVGTFSLRGRYPGLLSDTHAPADKAYGAGALGKTEGPIITGCVGKTDGRRGDEGWDPVEEREGYPVTASVGKEHLLI